MSSCCFPTSSKAPVIRVSQNNQMTESIQEVGPYYNEAKEKRKKLLEEVRKRRAIAYKQFLQENMKRARY